MTMTDFIHPLPEGPHEGENETRQQGLETKASQEESHESWPDPVDGTELLDQLAREFRRFLILPDHGEAILALWNLHSYCFELFDHTPILYITSPTKQCAKSRVLEVLAKLAHNPMSSSSMNGATLFRSIETFKPTLLLDEMDRIPMEKKTDITMVLNAGYAREGKVHRCQGHEYKVVRFGVYCPKALAGIGDYITNTVTDRSIQLSMYKKRKSQEVEKFRRYQPEEWQRKCVRWSQDNLDTLEQCQPQMPEALSDRQEDIWEPLFAIAQCAGGQWVKKCWAAASAQAADSVTQVTDDLLSLAAIREFFTENQANKAASSDICGWLNAQDDLPFKDLRMAQGIDPLILARKLKPFGITPRNLNLGDRRLKGYLLEQLEIVFERYLPPENPPGQPLPATHPENTGRNEDSWTLPGNAVADDSAPKNGQSSGVAAEEGVPPVKGTYTPQEGPSREFAFEEEF